MKTRIDPICPSVFACERLKVPESAPCESLINYSPDFKLQPNAIPQKSPPHRGYYPLLPRASERNHEDEVQGNRVEACNSSKVRPDSPVTKRRNRHGLGGVRDAPDARDHPYVPPADVAKNLPSSVGPTKVLPARLQPGSGQQLYEQRHSRRDGVRREASGHEGGLHPLSSVHLLQRARHGGDAGQGRRAVRSGTESRASQSRETAPSSTGPTMPRW